MHVIGTAGHVDHGKTSLLRALTGMEPSRLAEERSRGMTMQLGFVWMTGPEGRPIGIVDVPGHADYRLHTITGASTIDAFVFICACDDGWMPQSEEHLWALAAYGITHGVVVLTKTDLVDAKRFAEVKAELEVRFYEALGREVPIVGFSAKTNAGLEDLKRELFRELGELPAEKDVGCPQMFVDRVFTVAGQGTVVTGTLRDGKLHERQMIEVLPSGKKAEIRSIQSYGKQVKTAHPSARVALQLANLSLADVPKDSQIVDPAQLFLTQAVDLRLRLYLDYAINPKKNPEVILVHGGVKTKGKLIAIAPLENVAAPAWHVRLKLDVSRLIRFDEHCLVVSSGGDKVLGAGRVIDELPTTSVTVAASLLALVDHFTVHEYLMLNLLKDGAFRSRDLMRRTRFAKLEVMPDGVEVLDKWIVDRRRVDEWLDAILALVAKHHTVVPTDEGIAETALQKAMRLDVDLLRTLLRELKREGRLQQVGPYLKIFGYVPKADRTMELTATLETLAASTETVAPSLLDLEVNSDDKRRIVARFVADAKLVRLGQDHLVSTLVFQAMTRRVVEYLGSHAEATAADLRDALKLGRKLVVLVLEAMDHAKITERKGEGRVLTAAHRAAPAQAFESRIREIANSDVPELLSHADLSVDTPEKAQVLTKLVEDGIMVQLDEKMLMTAPAFAAVSQRILDVFERRGPLAAGEVRDELQIGRKIVVFVMEAMDRQGITVRDGERRGVK